VLLFWLLFFFFKQKTAYEMRISDWSSDVCSSDLAGAQDDEFAVPGRQRAPLRQDIAAPAEEGGQRLRRVGQGAEDIEHPAPADPAAIGIEKRRERGALVGFEPVQKIGRAHV